MSEWEKGRVQPGTDVLAAMARLYHVPLERLIGDDEVTERRNGRVAEETAEPYQSNAARLGRLTPRVAEIVRGYLRRMELAGCSHEQIDEAERLMVDSTFSKLNAPRSTPPTEADQITDIEAAWDWIVDVLGRQGIRP